MIKIIEKEGFELNPNKKIRDNILKALLRNNGYCPCNQKGVEKEDTKCPCKAYREQDYCCCKLYTRYK